MKMQTNSTKTTPQQVKDKGVEHMFDAIANKYDTLNHLLSLGIDLRWKHKVAKIIAQNLRPQHKNLPEEKPSKKVLDVATGTADIVLKLSKLGVPQIIGIDISEQMLRIGREKIQKQQNQQKHKAETILLNANAMAMPFADNEFDGLTCGFGVRNFSDLNAGLREFHRVLKPQGICCIIEYCRGGGGRGLWGRLWGFYFRRLLPFVGGLISKDRSAYRYLPDSVGDFCSSLEFAEVLESAGFQRVSRRELMGGIVTIFTAYKV